MLNSIESEKKQADADFEALKKQHPELRLNDKDKEWYTNDRAYRELLHKDLSSKNLEQLRQQGLQYEKNIQTKNFQAGISFSTTPKEETPKEKLLRETEESRQQNSTRIEELNQKIANGSITLDERFELNTLENPHAVALSETEKAVVTIVLIFVQKAALRIVIMKTWTAARFAGCLKPFSIPPAAWPKKP